MSPANLAGAPGAFRGLHAVRVAKRTKQVLRIDRSTPNEMDPDPALSFATSFFVTPDHAERFTATNPELPALLRG